VRFLIILLISFLKIYSQDISDESLKYKEDQIYFGISYIIIDQKINGFKQNGFSRGFQLGIFKDISLRLKGDLAVGLGLGYSLNHQISNLNILKDSGGNEIFSLLNSSSQDSKINIYNNSVDFPLEFRWRTSTIENYSFWRIYAGYKLSYRFSNFIKSSIGKRSLENIRPISQSITLSLGYNTWNLFFEYGLTNIFKNYDKIGNEISYKLTPIKIGLIFYIL
jgi:hypothetical protein